jgi:hypothetical protein
MENGKWKMENGKWKMENVKSKEDQNYNNCHNIIRKRKRERKRNRMVTSFCIPYLSAEVPLDTVVFAIEKIHNMGKIDKIMCTKKGTHCTCYVYMEYWDDRKEINDIVDTIRKRERYRMYYNKDRFLVLFPNFRAVTPTPPVHMDLVMAVPSHIKDSTMLAYFNELHIGKIRCVTSEPMAKSEHSFCSSRQVLWYDANRSLGALPVGSLKCIIVQFEYWYLSDLAICMQADILKKQFYVDTKKDWRIYYEAPTEVGINPHRWTRH